MHLANTFDLSTASQTHVRWRRDLCGRTDRSYTHKPDINTTVNSITITPHWFIEIIWWHFNTLQKWQFWLFVKSLWKTTEKYRQIRLSSSLIVLTVDCWMHVLLSFFLVSLFYCFCNIMQQFLFYIWYVFFIYLFTFIFY